METAFTIGKNFRFVYNAKVLAFVYIAVIVFLGDLICRRFFSFVSLQQRLATAFLSGFLLSSGITYLFALLFAGTPQPLLWANLLFLALSFGLLVFLRRGGYKEQPGDGALGHIFRAITRNRTDKAVRFDSGDRTPGDARWDWIVLGICLVLGTWLMFVNLGFYDGSFYFSVKSWSDFGPHLSLAQSFALGHNFPTEHPFYANETIRYHFLFWFQAANLSYLGLNLVWAINLLSLMSLMSLLVLIMTFAEVLFNTRVVGRISAVLFFFAASSLSYIPFLLSQEGIGGALRSIVNANDYIKSGYGFRGDDWGALTVGVFANQRHLITGVGILFIVLIYLVDFFSRRGAIAAQTPERAAESVSEIEEWPEDGNDLATADVAAFPEISEIEAEIDTSQDFRKDIKAMIFCAVLIAALPYFNSAVFVAAGVVFGGLLIFFPQRRYIALLIVTIVLIGLPQVLMLRAGNTAPTGQALFHWGYIITDPTVPLVFQYLGWTFGFKWLLLLIAIWFAPNSHRRLFAAFSLLVPVVFILQLSTDSFNNHKLLNLWNIFATIYAAYALWMLGRANLYRCVLSAVLAVAMIFGSIVDLFPLHNDSWVVVPHKNDRLTTWLLENTEPTDVFLSDTLLSHPILFTGRKLYLGNTYFSWTAGYTVGEREKVYRKILQERNLSALTRMLNENKIAYVAIDDGVRKNSTISGFSESVYQQNFERVFEDIEKRYGNLNVYRVISP